MGSCLKPVKYEFEDSISEIERDARIQEQYRLDDSVSTTKPRTKSEIRAGNNIVVAGLGQIGTFAFL